MSVNPNSDHANVRTRVDKAYYNVFVSESNITNDLVLPTATINDAQTDDQNKGSGIDQLYDIQIAQSQIYSCNIIKQDDIVQPGKCGRGAKWAKARLAGSKWVGWKGIGHW